MIRFNEIFYPINLNLLGRSLNDWQGRRLNLEVATPEGKTPITRAIPLVLEDLRDQWNLRYDTEIKVDYSDLRPWLIQQLRPGHDDGRQQVIETIVHDFDLAYKARLNVVQGR